jgi:hypothetical protein
LASPGSCPSSWCSGGGACCADFQVLAVGGAAVPLPGAGLGGGCLPREAPGATAPVAGQLWKPGFSSGRNSVCRAWRLRGGAADLLSWGRSVLAVLGGHQSAPPPRAIQLSLSVVLVYMVAFASAFAWRGVELPGPPRCRSFSLVALRLCSQHGDLTVWLICHLAPGSSSPKSRLSASVGDRTVHQLSAGSRARRRRPSPRGDCGPVLPRSCNVAG